MKKLIHFAKGLIESEIKTKEGVLQAIITSEVVDRAGDKVKADGWDFKSYMKNPVLLWSHNSSFSEKRPSIGKVLKIWQEGKKTKAQMLFDMADSFAADIYRKYKEGFLNAFSVGFQVIEEDQSKNLITKQELLELSGVNVPANQDALVEMREAGVEMNKDWDSWLGKSKTKSVIPYAKHPLADVGMTWDGPAQMSSASTEALKVICAWYDSENPEVKSSYKLPHHLAEGHKTVWKGVAAAMGALLGARGGVNIPAGDKKGVYNHLAKHYSDFGKTPPEYKEYTETQFRIYELEQETNELRSLLNKQITASGESRKRKKSLKTKKSDVVEELSAKYHFDERERRILKVVKNGIDYVLGKMNKQRKNNGKN